MKGKGKRLRALWAILAVALILVLLAGALLPHRHEGGEDCPLYAMTAGRGLFALLLCALAPLAEALSRLLCGTERSRVITANPVHHKDKLLN